MATPDYTNYPDEQLLALLAQGDQAAFTIVYNRYRDKLYSFAYDLSRSEEKARDIVHDVFARLWENRAALSGREIVGSYLYQMTRNRQIDQLRRFAKETLILAELTRDKSAGPPGPDDLLDYREMQATLQVMIERLPARQREVYRLHRDQGLSYAEIAAQLGLSASTVENHFTRALQTLRTLLHRHFTETFLFSLLLGAVIGA